MTLGIVSLKLRKTSFPGSTTISKMIPTHPSDRVVFLVASVNAEHYAIKPSWELQAQTGVA